MGFVLALLYLVITYLGPYTVFGQLSAYHIELVVAILVMLVSLPSVPMSFVVRTPQALALIGLSVAVFMSVLMTGWTGGAVQAFQDFIPNAFAYFLVCLHCNSRRKVKGIVVLLLFVCFFVIAHGLIEMRAIPADTAHLPDHYSTAYLMGERNAAGQLFFRLRGQNFINDPNDFGQLIVTLIPLVFIFWRRKKIVQNMLFVTLPVSVLIYGAYLTHSRGCLLALLVMAILAGRHRIGAIPSLALAGGMFVAASRLGFTGGRDISAQAGEGRMALWGESIGALKTHPLFGVGFGRLPDYLGLTAHNSIMVCAAELGMFGLFCWSMFLFPALRDAITIASPSKTTDGQVAPPEDQLYLRPSRSREKIDKPEINRLGHIIVLSFAGFLVTGFFLSRAFVMTFFLLGGLGEVVYEWALQQGMVSPRLKLARVCLYAGVLAVALVVGVYVLLRLTF